MHCPFCRHPDSRVVDSRTSDDGQAIRRRRQCPECGRRFTTIENASLSVVKRSGATEPFSRDKIVAGVRKACQGRPVSEDDLALLAQRVEEALRSSGSAEIDAYEIGLAILGPLRELDEVAYLRFASVYQAFDSLEDFESAITSLRDDRERRPTGSVEHSGAAEPGGTATAERDADGTRCTCSGQAGVHPHPRDSHAQEGWLLCLIRMPQRTRAQTPT
jgi:transcriptional repressor NrdR